MPIKLHKIYIYLMEKLEEEQMKLCERTCMIILIINKKYMLHHFIKYFLLIKRFLAFSSSSESNIKLKAHTFKLCYNQLYKTYILKKSD